MNIVDGRRQPVLNALEIHGLSKSFSSLKVIEAIDLVVETGEFCVFVGPSGCGKSTLLRMIAGLDEVSSGEIRIDGDDVTLAKPSDRGVAMVFQSYALYPHMTVRENIGFSLKISGVNKAEISRKVSEVSQLLHLEALLDRKPAQLSGGQRQRVAIGRALVRKPKLFLFDEPLSNLDASLRSEMRVELAKLHKRLGATMVYVTHDQVEAMTMADKIVVLNGGRIEQIGAPMELYRRPQNLFVASFLGTPKMNFLDVEVHVSDEQGTIIKFGSLITFSMPHAKSLKQGRYTLGIRPESLSLVDGDVAMKGSVEFIEQIGSETILHVALTGNHTVVAKVAANTTCQVADSLNLGFAKDDCLLFDESGKLMN